MRTFPNVSTEQEVIPFSIKNENFHPKHPNLLQINTDINSQLEILIMMFTEAISANRPIDQDKAEKRSNQLIFSEETFIQKFEQNLNAGF